MKSKIILLLISLITISCIQKVDTKMANAPEIVINVPNIKQFKTDNSLDIDIESSNLKFEHIQLDDNFLIGKISRLLIINNNYIIHDNIKDVVAIFDSTGIFVKQIGNKGRGPNEYLSITHIDYDRFNNCIEIFDDANRKMFIYNIQGDLIKTINTPYNFLSFVKVSDGYFVYSTFEINQGKFNLLHLDNNLKKIKSTYFKSNHFFDRQSYSNNFTTIENEVYFRYGLNNIIYKIENSEVYPYLLIDFKEKGINYPTISELNNSLTYEASVYKKNFPYIGNVGNLLANKNFIMFTFSELSRTQVPQYYGKFDKIEKNTSFYHGTSSHYLLSGYYPIYLDNDCIIYINYPYSSNQRLFDYMNKNFGTSRDSNPFLIKIYI